MRRILVIDQYVFGKLVSKMQSGKLAAYVGAGFSSPSGLADWSELMKPLAKSIELEVTKNSDYMSLAQYFVDAHGRNDLDDILRNTFGKGNTCKNQESLAQLNLSEIWTTNYDDLIERALRKCGKGYDVKSKESDLVLDAGKGTVPVYKIHGDYRNPSECILTQRDYEDFFKNRKNFIHTLKSSLMQKTFIFVGFSFKDVDIKYILSDLRFSLNGGSTQTHYWITRKDPKWDKNEKNNYKLFSKSLKQNYNIETIEIEEYDDIPILFQNLQKYSKRKRIFISGAYCQENDEDDLQYENRRRSIDHFIEKLASNIVDKENVIVSGYGLGVGSAVISGALRGGYEKYDCQKSSSYLSLHPFPQNVVDDTKRKQLWSDYRDEMCEESGVQIILFGKKKNKESGQIVDSDGVRDEFSKAHSKGLFIIPVGSTEGVAQTIYKEMSTKLDTFEYFSITLKEKFKQLETLSYKDNCDELINVIMGILEEIQEYKD